jgi:hypothetical protein
MRLIRRTARGFVLRWLTIAVRRYLRYGLSHRDVEELLAERGINADHVSVYRQRAPGCGSIHARLSCVVCLRRFGREAVRPT